MSDWWARLREVVRRLVALEARLDSLESRQVSVEQSLQQQGSDGRANAG